MFRTCLVVVILIFTQHASAKTTVTIAVNSIEGLVELDSSDAPYNQILDKLKTSLIDDFNIKFDYYPGARAAIMFQSQRSDCLFPASKNSPATDFTIIDSVPINFAHAYFFSKSLITAKELLDKNQTPVTIAYKRGNTYGANISKLTHHNLITMDSDKKAIDFALKGRAEVVIAYMPDFAIMQGIADKAMLKYDDSSHLYSQHDSIICGKSEGVTRFIEAANKVLDTLSKTGEMKQILGDVYTPSRF